MESVHIKNARVPLKFTMFQQKTLSSRYFWMDFSLVAPNHSQQKGPLQRWSKAPQHWMWNKVHKMLQRRQILGAIRFSKIVTLRFNLCRQRGESSKLKVSCQRWPSARSGRGSKWAKFRLVANEFPVMKGIPNDGTYSCWYFQKIFQKHRKAKTSLAKLVVQQFWMTD